MKRLTVNEQEETVTKVPYRASRNVRHCHYNEQQWNSVRAAPLLSVGEIAQQGG